MMKYEGLLDEVPEKGLKGVVEGICFFLSELRLWCGGAGGAAS